MDKNTRNKSVSSICPVGENDSLRNDATHSGSKVWNIGQSGVCALRCATLKNESNDRSLKMNVSMQAKSSAFSKAVATFSHLKQAKGGPQSSKGGGKAGSFATYLWGQNLQRGEG